MKALHLRFPPFCTLLFTERTTSGSCALNRTRPVSYSVNQKAWKETLHFFVCD